jgi:Cu+-exporting ATPase
MGPAAGASAEPATPRSISADSREVRFAVKGIHCQGCVNSIESSVGRVAGVRSVDVSLEGESARVRCSVETPMDAIVAAIGEAGYKATVVPAADAGAATMPPHEDRPGAD